MKIALVDDERQVLTGMRFIIEKYLPEHEVVLAEENPLRALKILQCTPVDLIFTDVKMAEMSGVSLVAHIRRNWPDTYVIVVSAYADFEFVRSCMLNGAYDYLLKPASYKSIVQIIQRIARLLADTQRQKKGQYLEKSSIDALHGKAAYCGLEKGQPAYVAVFRGEYVQTYQHLYEAVITKEWPEQEPCVYIDGHFAIISGTIDEKVFCTRLRKCLRSADERKLHLRTAFATGVNTDGALSVCYQDCVKMLDFYAFNQLGPVAVPREYEAQVARATQCRISECFEGKKVANLLGNRQQEALEGYLEHACEEVRGRHVILTPQSAKMELLEELYVLRTEIQDSLGSLPGGADAFRNMLGQIPSQPTLESMFSLVSSFLQEMGHKINGLEYPHYIYQAIQFIKMHYMTELPLRAVAEHVHLTQWYFSTQFKRYTGQTYSSYLMNVRIATAKELLRQKDLKIFEISEMCGFQEPTYFYTVFKRIVGVSPKQYRNR